MGNFAWRSRLFGSGENNKSPDWPRCRAGIGMGEKGANPIRGCGLACAPPYFSGLQQSWQAGTPKIFPGRPGQTLWPVPPRPLRPAASKLGDAAQASLTLPLQCLIPFVVANWCSCPSLFFLDRQRHPHLQPRPHPRRTKCYFVFCCGRNPPSYPDSPPADSHSPLPLGQSQSQSQRQSRARQSRARRSPPPSLPPAPIHSMQLEPIASSAARP